MTARMSHEHRNGSHAAPDAGRGAASSALAPGKRTLTEELGAGDTMPHTQRAPFERSLGRDLSGVRVHTGEAAAAQADRVDARAFATGQHIVFGRGEYRPSDRGGLHLFAHEVAHTAQQQGAAPAGELATTQPGDAAERNADTAAAAMLAGKPAQVAPQPAAIARKTKDESIDPPAAPEAKTDAKTGAGDAAGATPGAADAAAGGAAPGKDGEIGELTAERIAADPYEGDAVGPDVPARNPETGKQDIAGAGQQLPAQGGAEELAGGAASAAGAAPAGAAPAGGDGGAAGAEVSAEIVAAQNDTREAIARTEAESAAYKADMAARRDQFEAEQHATMLEQLQTMTPVEKRQTLQEMGYDAKAIKKLKDSEIDGIIQGKMESEQRKTKILGMAPEELAALSPAQKIQYLVDLGIDRGDLDKVGPGKAAQLFDDIMKVAHVPGQHQVKIKIKGGLLGKSWVVNVKCDAEGKTDIQAQKEGGFLSKLWGWVKLALPIILTALAPLTAGASLVVLAIYQTATAIKNGDWLGAVMGAATAVIGVGAVVAAVKGVNVAATAFAKISDVATKVKKVAEAAQLAMTAAKAKNAGSLLGALAAGAAVFAAKSGETAGKFAETMKRWSDRLEKWGKIISGGQKVVQSIQKGDPIAAIGGAFDTAVTVAGAKTATGKALTRASKITGFVNAGKQALAAKPPSYAAVAEAALGIAGQLKEDRRLDDANRIIASATRLKAAWDKRDSDPSALAEAALGLAESIQLAKYDVEHDEKKGEDGKPAPDEARAAITTRYERAGKIVTAASAVLKAATAKPRPSYVAALDAATQLVAELTASKKIDAAAEVTSKLNAWTQAVNAKDPAAIAEAILALGEAIHGLHGVIAEEHASAKKDAQAQLAPGETLPDDGGAELPPGPDGPAAMDDAPGEQDPTPTNRDSGIGGPYDDGNDYAITPVSYQPGQSPQQPAGPAKPAAPPKQPTIPGKIIAGGPLSNADVEAIETAAKSVANRRYIAYSDVIKVGGALAWRANNPGNLRDASTKIGTIPGEKGNFAVFATMEDGRAAQRALYLNKYGAMTVRDAIEALTPRVENNTDRYLADLEKAGVDLDKDVKSQIDILMPAVAKNEGKDQGKVVPRSPDRAPVPDGSLRA
ncbi:MAG: DUF4157 domain-containing protein [Deltaproteobacteria bacterium]|nr:MAG: DUF4157 domain-containing protein [Deltaproteobacteria bacterium]